MQACAGSMNSNLPGITKPMNDSQNMPECFGFLERVFPMGENGLRHSPGPCMTCAHKTECLKAAVSKDKGLQVKEEKVDRAWQAGRISFLQRWARKKSIHKNRQKKDRGDTLP